MKRIFDFHVGVDYNEVTGDTDLQVHGRLTKGAENTFVGGCIINMIGALEKQTTLMDKRNVIEVVDNIPADPIAQSLEDKWIKK